MKISKKLLDALEVLEENKCSIESGNNDSTITQEWVDAMYKIIEVLVEQTVEKDHHGRRHIEVAIQYPGLHQNGLPILIPRLDWHTSTPENKSRALSYALINLRKAMEVLDSVYSFSPKGT